MSCVCKLCVLILITMCFNRFYKTPNNLVRQNLDVMLKKNNDPKIQQFKDPKISISKNLHICKRADTNI